MAVIMQPTPPSAETEADITLDCLHRLTVEQYHAIARAGIIDEDEPVELLEGLLVVKGCDPPPTIREDGSEVEDDGVTLDSIYRLTVAQYHAMARRGVLADGDPVELLEGFLVRKMTKRPPHTVAAGLVHDALSGIAPRAYHVGNQDPVTTSDSEPEPDLCLVRGGRRDYLKRHPGPTDLVLVVEVADSSLRRDRGTKKRMYARDRIPVYWIVNLKAHTIEVYTEPSGPIAKPTYGRRQEYGEEEEVPVVIDGHEVGRIAVKEVLP